MQPIIAAASALLFTAAPTAEQVDGARSIGGVVQRQIRVPSADLDIARPSGKAVMLRRIQAAAEQVCAPKPSSIRELGAQQAFDRCVRTSAGAAVGSLHQSAAGQAAARRGQAGGSERRE